MTLPAEREDARVEIGTHALVLASLVVFGFGMTENVIPSASFWRGRMSQKVMAISYFAEIKGVVGCLYQLRLAFKVRELVTFGN